MYNVLERWAMMDLFRFVYLPKGFESPLFICKVYRSDKWILPVVEKGIVIYC